MNLAAVVAASLAGVTVASGAFQPRGNRGPGPQPLSPAPSDLMNEDQVNRVRQVELQERDAQNRRPPAIRFEDRALQRFVESRPDLSFREFNAAPDVAKALFILENSDDEELVGDVRIVTDPGSLLTFKQSVHPAVIQSCATAACHGGGDAGRFVLYPQPRSDEAIYTNFYTLTQTTAQYDDPAGAAFGGGEVLRRMIDRAQPDQSLLLQYWLPADTQGVDYPHPEVEGWQPPANGPDDPAFRAIREWIATDLRAQAGGYGLDFTPPGDPDVTDDEQPEDEPQQGQEQQGQEQQGQQ